uniref:IBH1-like N-terminal domain-containing protein n=1 Tax=Picea sitchensis TaxID=3332 RepID=A9NUX4_PICSI|nr:unknown [Picea sitchensis]
MEDRYGGGKESAWRAGFQRKYFSRVVAVLRSGRIENATSASARIRTVKFAADLSMAMTSRGRTAWSRAILGKYIIRLKRSRCQLRVVKSRGNLHGIRTSASGKSSPCKRTAVCKKLARRFLGNSRHRGLKGTGVTVASRMQTLRLLIPGSHGLDTPVFLKEAADYIVALKMQIQAMQALADSNSGAHAAWQV